MRRFLAGLLAVLGLIAYGAVTVAVVWTVMAWCVDRLLAFFLAMLIFAA